MPNARSPCSRSAPWKVARGAIGGLLQAFAAVLPHPGTGRPAEAGRALHRCIAGESDFWRDETLDLAAPLVATGVLALVEAVHRAAGRAGWRDRFGDRCGFAGTVLDRRKLIAAGGAVRASTVERRRKPPGVL